MKKLFIILLFVADSVFGQHIVKVNPMGFAWNSTSLEWEMREGNQAIILDVMIPERIKAPSWMNTNDFLTCRTSVNGVLAGYRRYVKNGWYWQAYVKEQTFSFWTTMLNIPNTSLEGYMYSTSVGGNIGYQWKYKRFVADVFIGPEIGRANGNANSYSLTHNDALLMKTYVTNKINELLPSYVHSDVQVNGNITNTRINSFAFPWIRVGFTIGYKL